MSDSGFRAWGFEFGLRFRVKGGCLEIRASVRSLSDGFCTTDPKTPSQAV